MNKAKRDSTFLGEFVEFTCDGPSSVADALFRQYRASCAEGDYNRASHFQARLHSEMVMAMETLAAHMYAYSKWDSPAGVLGTLVSYGTKELHSFLDRLFATDTPTELLKLPSAEALKAVAEDPRGLDDLYTEPAISRIVKESCAMFRDKDIRDVHNRAKHGAVYTRHLAFLQSGDPKSEPTTAIKFLHPSKQIGVFDVASIEITGRLGLRVARQYVANVKVITKHAKDLALFVAMALDNGLMRK